MKNAKLVLLAVIAFLVFDSSATSTPKKEHIFCPQSVDPIQERIPQIMGDWLPWPMGSECQIPWRKIEGTWIRAKDDDLGHFRVETSEIIDGGRFVTVTKVNSSGSMLEEGASLVFSKDRVIAVVMRSVDPSKSSYTLFIRHYAEDGSCEDGKLATVITIRIDEKSCENDVNFIMKKAPKQKGMGKLSQN